MANNNNEEVREIRQEFRRLTHRFGAAVALGIVTAFTKTESKSGHVAVFWAKEMNLLAHLCFLTTVVGIVLVPMEIERLRTKRRESDARIFVGSVCLLVSFAFFAYLRCFVDV
ncbi:unnamed protein product [Cochlearia groenlandica]